MISVVMRNAKLGIWVINKCNLYAVIGDTAIRLEYLANRQLVLTGWDFALPFACPLGGGCLPQSYA